jgi:hypothetical protein
MDNWVSYDLKNCCPNLKPKCDNIAPNINFRVLKPTTTANADGSIRIEFIGLYSRYKVSWSDQETSNIYSGVVTRNNLVPGEYSVAIQDLINEDCIWTYLFTVPSYTDFDVELYYRDFLTEPVPRLPYAPVTPFVIPENYKLYWNNDRVLKRGTDANTQCFELIISGGTAPYTIEWGDFITYSGIVPVNLIPPNIPIPKQTNNNGFVNVGNVQFSNRHPIVLDKQKINDLKNVTEACINLANYNGNGWIRIVVKDSSFPNKKIKTLWLYLKQSPLT